MLKRYIIQNSRIVYQHNSTCYLFYKIIWFDGYETWWLNSMSHIGPSPIQLKDTPEWQQYRREITKLITEYHERNRIISRSRNS
jgi:hypothetical protein